VQVGIPWQSGFRTAQNLATVILEDGTNDGEHLTHSRLCGREKV
jgi:hypothetical protein